MQLADANDAASECPANHGAVSMVNRAYRHRRPIAVHRAYVVATRLYRGKANALPYHKHIILVN